MFDFPSPPLPRKLPLLEGAMGLTGPRGMCFHRSAALCMDVPGSFIIFATFRAATEEERRVIGPLASPVPFIHCFVLHRGAVLAPSTIERTENKLVAFLPAQYFELNGARDMQPFSRPDLLKLAKLHGFRQHFLKHVPLRSGASFGTVLLDAAGIEWEATPEGGVIPKTKGVS